MKLLWLTWRDLSNPEAGGAELVNEELAKRLVADGHEVVLLVGGYAGCEKEETVNGYKIIRVGNRYSVYWHTYRYYTKHFRGWADVVIEEINTMPYFSGFYVKERTALFFHQLCREIWFYQMVFPLSVVGYLAEPLYLRLINKQPVITISESSKLDIMRYGFRDVAIISEGIKITPVRDLQRIKKSKKPTLLAFGSIRPMKRTIHQIQAFERAKQHIPDLRLVLSGSPAGRYGKQVLELVRKSEFSEDIEFTGRLDDEGKQRLMQQCHLLLVTSVKEGWCLVVTEAASQGTPAIVYDADGLRDSVQHGKTGLVTTQNTPQALADDIVSLLSNNKKYERMRRQAWRQSQEITFDKSYEQFKATLAI